MSNSGTNLPSFPIIPGKEYRHTANSRLALLHKNETGLGLTYPPGELWHATSETELLAFFRPATDAPKGSVFQETEGNGLVDGKLVPQAQRPKRKVNVVEYAPVRNVVEYVYSDAPDAPPAIVDLLTFWRYYDPLEAARADVPVIPLGKYRHEQRGEVVDVVQVAEGRVYFTWPDTTSSSYPVAEFLSRFKRVEPAPVTPVTVSVNLPPNVDPATVAASVEARIATGPATGGAPPELRDRLKNEPYGTRAGAPHPIDKWTTEELLTEFSRRPGVPDVTDEIRRRMNRKPLTVEGEKAIAAYSEVRANAERFRTSLMDIGVHTSVERFNPDKVREYTTRAEMYRGKMMEAALATLKV